MDVDPELQLQPGVTLRWEEEEEESCREQTTSLSSLMFEEEEEDSSIIRSQGDGAAGSGFCSSLHSQEVKQARGERDGGVWS